MTDTKPRMPNAPATWRVLLAGYWLALVVGTHLPPTFAGLPGERSDKLVHLAAYAGLAWLLAVAWQSSTGRLNGRHLRFAWLAIASFAAADEITQLLVGRSASVGDWLADAAGAAVGLAVFRACQIGTSNS
jgi:VanZ family protein